MANHIKPRPDFAAEWAELAARRAVVHRKMERAQRWQKRMLWAVVVSSALQCLAIANAVWQLVHNHG